jgi:hypothetical protein
VPFYGNKKAGRDGVLLFLLPGKAPAMSLTFF